VIGCAVVMMESGRHPRRISRKGKGSCAFADGEMLPTWRDREEDASWQPVPGTDYYSFGNRQLSPSNRELTTSAFTPFNPFNTFHLYIYHQYLTGTGGEGSRVAEVGGWVGGWVGAFSQELRLD
jgi:hypothetical protein